MVTKLLFTAGIILLVLFGWKFISQMASVGGRPSRGEGSDDAAPKRSLGKAERRAEDLEWDEASGAYRPREHRD